jgi:hypothetical protein
VNQEQKIALLHILKDKTSPQLLRYYIYTVLGPGSFDRLRGENHVEWCIAFMEELYRVGKEDRLLEEIMDCRPDIDFSPFDIALDSTPEIKEPQPTEFLPFANRKNDMEELHRRDQEDELLVQLSRSRPDIDISEPIKTEKPSSEGDEYSVYQDGTRELISRLSDTHPRYADACVYQQRLEENIARSRRYGDTETHRAERAEILVRLNTLTLSVIGISFDELCKADTDTRLAGGKRGSGTKKCTS